MIEKIEEILQFWFGDLREGYPVSDKRALWWDGTAEHQALVEELFGHRVRQALRGDLDHWDMMPRGRLALILLLDRFPRILNRGHESAFAGDQRALEVCASGLEVGHDQALEFAERQFFYTPLQHSEVLADQECSVRCFEQLLREVPPHRKIEAQTVLDYAHQCRYLIERFGRFPQRNLILGRTSSAEELVFLNQNGSR